MKVLNQKSAFLLKTVSGHSFLKEHILNAIRSMGQHSVIEEPIHHIVNSDWHLNPNTKRAYANLVTPIIDPLCDEIKVAFNLPEIKLTCVNLWFQQYGNGDYHDWHVHPTCLYSGVYYVDLPDRASKTSFRFIDEEFDIDVQEGDILIFPGSTVHRSKPNESDKIKTIISFNFT